MKAVADPTRLRLLALLERGEATVGELQTVLDQSQPRVSRHLRLLSEAGLVERFREGHWVYYRLAAHRSARRLVEAAIGAVGNQDRLLGADRQALAEVTRVRQRAAYNERGASGAWLAGAYARPPTDSLRSVLDEALDETAYGDVLDIGCGGGALLPLLAPRARFVVGADISRSARVLARSRVREGGLGNCTIRAADLRRLPFEDERFDLVLLDEVLSSIPDALSVAIAETLRVLRPAGRLVIVDRISPVASRLRAELPATLIDNQLSAVLAAAGARVTARNWLPGRAPDYALFVAAPHYALERTGSDV